MSERATAVLLGSWLALASAPLLACACDGPPPRAAVAGPPQWIALDAEFPAWELSRWALNGFTNSLRHELESYDIHVDDRPAPDRPLVQVNLGHYGNWRAIDVEITRAGRTAHAGRVMIPDRSMTTLDVSASLVASVIASGLRPPVDPAPPASLPP
jgi:hypothetical protein